MKISKTISDEILGLLLKSYSVGNEEIIALHEPKFSGDDIKYLEKCIETGMVSSIGPYVEEFEKLVATFTKAKYAVATVNGTTALHLALVVSDLPAGSEVLVPSLSFVATANAVAHANLVPHFINSEVNSLGINTERLKEYLDTVARFKNGCLVNKTTDRIISGIIPMHCFGHPSNMNDILKLAKTFNLRVIEDAAEALGSFYEGRHCGTLGDIGVISFNGNKVLTTGGGGVLITDNIHTFRRAKHLSTTAKKNAKVLYEHDQVGFNYRMPNINAALGVAQFKSLKISISRKRQLANKLRKAFRHFRFGEIFSEMAGTKSNYWLNTLIFDNELIRDRNQIIEELNSQNIMVRPCWTPLHKLPMFLSSPKDDMRETEILANRIMNLPSSGFLL